MDSSHAGGWTHLSALGQVSSISVFIFRGMRHICSVGITYSDRMIRQGFKGHYNMVRINQLDAFLVYQMAAL